MNNNVGPGQFILSLPEKRAKKVWLNHIKPVHSHRCFAQDAYARASVIITLRGYTGHKAAASPPGPAFDMLKPGYESRRMGITSHVSGNFPLGFQLTRHVSGISPLKYQLTRHVSGISPLKYQLTRHVSRNFTPGILTYTPCNGK